METEIERAASLMAEGSTALDAGDYATAKERFAAALAVFRQVLGDTHPDVAASLNNLGVVSNRLGDYVVARNYYLEALAIKQQALGEAHPDVATSLNNLGNLSASLGDYAAARDYFEQALAIDRQALGETHPDVATSLNNLGVVSNRLGDHTAARDYFEQALAIYRQALGDTHPDVAYSLNNLGVVSGHLGDYAAARDYHLQALAIRRQALGETHPDVAASLNNLGNVSYALGDYSAGRDYYLQALAIKRQALGETHPDVTTSLNNLGVVSNALGDYAAARDYHLQALAIRRQALGDTHPDVAYSLNNLGVVSGHLGDYAAARDYHLQALAIRRRALDETHPDVAASLNNLGNVSYALGDYSAARDYVEQALALWRATLPELHPDICGSLYGLAALARRERAFDRAGEFLEEALRIALVPDNTVHLAPAYRELSLLKAAEGAGDAAIFFGKQAVNAIQRQRSRLKDIDRELQRSFLSTKEDIYRDLSERLIEAGRLGEAQQVLAMLKEEELFDLLRRDAGNDPRLTFAQLTAIETEWERHGDALGQDLVRLAEQIAALRKIAARSAAQEAELRGARGALDAAGREFRSWLDGLQGELEVAGRSNVAEKLDFLNQSQRDVRELSKLKPGVAQLSYVLGENKVSIILTTASFQISRETEIAERDVNRLVHELRFAIVQKGYHDGSNRVARKSDDDDNNMDLASRALWRHLIAPVFDRLREIDTKTLMIVPYGALRYLPFAALHDGTRYLAEHFAVSILTLAANTRLLDAGSSDWQVAGFGVSREVPPYRRLMAVREELAGIVRTADGEAGIYPGTIRLDEAFTEQSFADALDAHEVVHVASHFVLNPAEGFHSHLLLGDGTTLNLERLRDPSFDFEQLDLMTLSACETAMGGKGKNGREFEGLGALVQLQGAKAVIASLWPVADESTAPLMQAFYRARHKGRSKAAALQAAQLSLLNGGPYTHPYHWAPFVLMGNWL